MTTLVLARTHGKHLKMADNASLNLPALLRKPAWPVEEAPLSWQHALSEVLVRWSNNLG